MTEIPAQGLYPSVDRMLPKDKANSRMLQLFIAIDKTIQEHSNPLLLRLKNMQSFWTADESDLKYILRRDFGDYFGDLTETEEDKRVYMWGVYEIPYYKHSLDIINYVTAQLNLYPGTFFLYRYYIHPSDNYLPENYLTIDDIAASGFNDADYVALSEITLRLDAFYLEKVGIDADTSISSIEAKLRQTLPDHLQMSYAVIKTAYFGHTQFAYGNSSNRFNVTIQN